MSKYFTLTEVSNCLGVSKSIVQGWEKSGKLVPDVINGEKIYKKQKLLAFEPYQNIINSNWKKEQQIEPVRSYRSIELFAGAGGLALGLEKAGFEVALLNEVDKHAGKTLQNNRPGWNVAIGDIQQLNFKHFNGNIDFLSGGFPCQAFSYAGNKQGFGDTRGTLFFEFARAIKEIQPRVFLGENVRGLLNHDKGRTLETIKKQIEQIGYTLVEPKVLKAIYHKVPQKRERLFLVGIRNDIFRKLEQSSKPMFSWPSPYNRVLTVKDALKAGELYNSDVPDSEGQKYPERKKEILQKIPQGGYWKDLSDSVQREYMQKSYFLGGGKTGMARRLSWLEPSLTLTCAPAQKQTERCHPEETRPLTIREYARIQTFPDDWLFSGSISAQYKQIGNAVPVNLAYAMGVSLIALLNDIEALIPRNNVYELPQWSKKPEQMAFLWERAAQYHV